MGLPPPTPADRAPTPTLPPLPPLPRLPGIPTHDVANDGTTSVARRILQGVLILALGIILGLAVTLGLAVNGLGPWADLSDEPAELAQPAASAPSVDVETVVDAGAFSFRMPGEPSVERFDDAFMGIAVTGTGWTSVHGDEFVSVFAMEWPEHLDREAAEGGFDAALGGIARRSEGRIVIDHEIAPGRDVAARRAEIEIDEGRVFVEFRARDNWIVAITGASPAPGSPPDFDRLVESFRWTPSP